MVSRFLRPLLSLALCVILLLLAVWAVQIAAAPQSAQADFATVAAVSTAGSPAPGKLVVAVSPGTDEATVIGLLDRSGATLDRYLPRLGLALVSAPLGGEMAAAGALAADPLVDFVTGHRPAVQIADVPPDQYFGQQWGMVKVQGPAAWDLAWGDPGVPVAVIDTGVNTLHQDLRDRIWRNPGESAINPATGQRDCSQPLSYNGVDDDENGFVDDCRGWNFAYPPGNDPEDGNGHGTVVAGIVAATTNNYDPIIQGYAGVAGMARHATVMALRALDDRGDGYVFDIAQAIDYAAANHAQVINLSLTLPVVNPNPYDVEMLGRAVAAAQAAGVFVVAATGNQGYDGVAYPAKSPGVLAVGASTEADTRASFSNYGSRLDIVAPGVGIFSTLRQPGNQSYGLYNNSGNGTSFASPHAAGVAALVRALRPDLSQSAVYDLISRSADDVGAPGWDPQTGWGRLNAQRAVAEALYGLNLELSADPPTLAVGRQTTVQLQISAPESTNDERPMTNDGRPMTAAGSPQFRASSIHYPASIIQLPAGFGARVTFTSSAGVITPTVVTVDGAGRASVHFTADALTGTAEITATLGCVVASLPLTITSGQPAGLALAAYPMRIGTGGRHATITATVWDEGGSVVTDGTEVAFTTTLGSISPVTITTAGGLATTQLTSEELTGTALVTASAGAVTGTAAVEIVGAGRPFSVTLAVAPPAISVASAVPATIVATILDVLGDPVVEGTTVEFTTTLGTLTPTVTTTVNGEARVQLLSGAAPGLARITATAGGVTGQAEVVIVPGAAVSLTLIATPGELTAGYNQLAQLTITATDRFGNLVADGTAVALTASLGIVSPPTVTTTGGVAAASFIGEWAAGTSVITATAGDALGRTTVRIRPAAPGSLTLAVAPAKIGVGGQTATVTATVRDAFGNLAADGTAVEFSTDLGELQKDEGGRMKDEGQRTNDEGRTTKDDRQIADGGRWSSVVGLSSSVTLTVTTTEGLAVAELVSGPTPGTAHVRVTVAPNLLQIAGVPIRPGAPAALALTISPPKILPGARTYLSATVADEYGNPVAEGTAVRFVASRGAPRQADVPTAGGIASLWLTADQQLGSINIVAISGDASAFGTVEVVVVRGYVPLVLRR